MKCEFFLHTKKTQLNLLGMCEECIIVFIPDNILKELKEKQFKDIENRWANSSNSYLAVGKNDLN